jgi:hypothetical protein
MVILHHLPGELMRVGSRLWGIARALGFVGLQDMAPELSSDSRSEAPFLGVASGLALEANEGFARLMRWRMLWKNEG